jgi:hypothetical protein
MVFSIKNSDHNKIYVVRVHLLNEKCTKNKSRLNEKCTTLLHKSCIMNLDKKIVQEEKKGDRDGTIQLYKIFVF